jgi:hypothetical protein
VVGLDGADAGEDPGVDAVPGASLTVEPQVGGGDLRPGRRGRSVAGLSGLQTEDRAEDAGEQDEQYGQQAQQGEQRAGELAAVADRRAGCDRDGGRHGRQLPAWSTSQPAPGRVSSSGTV